MFDLIAALGVLAVLGGVMAITKLFGRHLSPEVSRKIIHVTMGCVALSLPFVFQHRMSVVYLGAAAVAALLFMRLNKGLREGIGTALLAVSRKSYGDIYFVFSIVIVFVLHKSTYEYLIPIMVLTFADSAAALVGTSYGRHNMAASHLAEDTKSREGSVMFFIVAFICALVPLQLMTEIGRAEVLVISFLAGLLGAMIEVVSTDGNDNLLLPLLTYSFIRYNGTQPMEVLFVNFGVMLLMLAAIVLIYKVASFSKLSIVYCLLAGYVVMILGGGIWILPPLMLLLTYGILPMMKDDEKQHMLTYKVIQSNTLVGIICLYVSVFLPQYRDILYVAFSLSFACHLYSNTYSRFVEFINAGKTVAALCGVAKSVAFIALPTFAFIGFNWQVMALYLALILASIPPIIALHKKYDYKILSNATNRANTLLTGALAAVFVAIMIVIGEFHDLS